MRILFTIVTFLIFSNASGQATITLDNVSKHIGDSITICGKVAGIRYFENSKDQPTFLNIGANYPDQKITVVIRGETRKLFTRKIEDLNNKEICITGRITLYKERAQIVIGKPEQIRLQ